MVSTKLLRAYLDDAWDNRNGQTLRVTLRAKESALLAGLESGSIISTSANGRNSQLLANSTEAGLTMVDVTEGYRFLIDTHDNAAVALGFSNVTTDPTQQQGIYTQMMTRLREIKGQTSNWMYLSR